MENVIRVRGARVNNLKNINFDIPLNKLTSVVGPSGSGKTSLAFHTLYNESKRRFLNSFPTYLKFFSDRPAAVDVDEIYPVLPVFALPQINPVVGTRSNVADIMHLTELLQNQFHHYSHEACPIHHTEFKEIKFSDEILKHASNDEDEVYYLFISKIDFLEFFENQPFPTRSFKSTRTKKVTDFDKDHLYWEVSRFKNKHIKNLDNKLKDILKKGLELFLFSERLNKLTRLNFAKGSFACSVEGCDQQVSPAHQFITRIWSLSNSQPTYRRLKCYY